MVFVVADDDGPVGLIVPVLHDPGGSLRFLPLPPPTTAEAEELTLTIARRLAARLAAASEEQGDYLDPMPDSVLRSS
jgi:hypothetical protein